MPIILALATWRLSSLITSEEGPFAVFERIREAVGVNRPGELTGLRLLFSCMWCMSVWAAAALLLIVRARAGLFMVMTLALSAAAILIEETRSKSD